MFSWDTTKIIALNKKELKIFKNPIKIKSNKLIKRFVFLIVSIQRNHRGIFIVPSNGFKAFKSKTQTIAMFN